MPRGRALRLPVIEKLPGMVYFARLILWRKTRMKKQISTLLVLALGLGAQAQAADYVIDGSGAGMHSSVHWKANHVGISPLWGRFNDISGSFTYDKDNIEDASIEVTIGTASLDSNHDERDVHLTSADFLDAAEYPQATFVSTGIEPTGEDTMRVEGELTLMGVTRDWSFEARRTGEGQTPFGDYRVGFEAEASLDASDFGISISPESSIDLILAIEGIRQ